MGAFCLLIGSLPLPLIVPQMLVMRRLFSRGGPALETIIQQVLSGPAAEVAPGTECPICISESGGESGRWRELPCRHAFHEECLLQRLQLSRRCPMCRFDLHNAP